MTVLLANNAVSKLGTSITATDTTISVTTGDGTKFPALSAGQWFPVVLIKASGVREILRCTARSGDILTVTRAQEGTGAQAFSAGDRVELRLTNAALAEFLQNGDTRLGSAATKNTGTTTGTVPVNGSDASFAGLSASGIITAAGEVKSTSANSFRIKQGNYGAFWRNDGATLNLMLTNSGDQDGSYNAFRPFAVNLATGQAAINGSLTGSASQLGGVAAASYMRKDTAQTMGASLTMNNGSSDTPEVTFQNTSISVSIDAVGSEFRAFVDGGTSFPFQFDCAAGKAKLFGYDASRIQSITKAASGTLVDFDIPTWARKITVQLEGVSQNQGAHFLVQLGGMVTGYMSRSTQIGDFNVISTSGFIWADNAAQNIITGHMIIIRGDNSWVSSHNSVQEGGAYWQIGAGRLGNGLSVNTLRFTTTNGTAVFDNGTITVLVEG